MAEYTGMCGSDDYQRKVTELGRRHFTFEANKWKRQRDVAVDALLALEKLYPDRDPTITTALDKIAEIERGKFKDD